MWTVKINHEHKSIIKMYHNQPLTQYFSTINHELRWIVAKTIHFSSKTKTRLINIIQGINHIAQKMKIIIAKTNNNLSQINKIIIGILINQILFINQILLINQIFLNHIHEMNKQDKQDKMQHQILINFYL